jgi:hypothetical protein
MRVQPPRRLRKHLQAHGERAIARILEIAPRGWNEFRDERGWDAESYNADPMRSWCRRKVRIRIEALSGSGPVELETKLTFRLATLPETAGTEIDVIVDPADPSKIVADDEALCARLGLAEREDAAAVIAAAGHDPDEIAALGEAVAAAERGGAGGGTGGLGDLISASLEASRQAQRAAAADPQGALARMQEAQLEQLRGLREQGALSDADYERARARLLGE